MDAILVEKIVVLVQMFLLMVEEYIVKMILGFLTLELVNRTTPIVVR
jgi:hypothetical protein